MVAVEVELKALTRNPQRLHAALSARAVGERSIYSDRYFDYPDRPWTRQGTELRVPIETRARDGHRECRRAAHRAHRTRRRADHLLREAVRELPVHRPGP